MKGIAIRTDGTIERVEIDGLKSMQAVVGGYLEMAPLTNKHFTLYCNEEGKLKGLPFNSVATVLADTCRNWRDPLVGDVLIMGPTDSNGGDTDVGEHVWELATALSDTPFIT